MRKILILLFIFFGSLSYGQNLRKAIYNGDIDKVEDWLNSDFSSEYDYMENPPVNSPNHKFEVEDTHNGNTMFVHPLVFACGTGQTEIVKLFVENKALFGNYKKLVSEGLGLSIQFNDIELVQLLLTEGADPNAFCKHCNNGSPIAIALNYEQYDIFELLLKNGAKLATPGSGFDVIHMAAKIDSLPFVVNLIETYNLDINQQGTAYGRTALMFAFESGNKAVVDYLVSKNADISLLDNDNGSILEYCTTVEDFLYAEKLLKDQNLFPSYPNVYTIMAKDNKALFDYYIRKFPERIFDNDLEGYNGYFALLHIEKNINHFFFALLEAGVPLEEGPSGYSVLQYAKNMKKEELKQLIKDNF